MMFLNRLPLATTSALVFALPAYAVTPSDLIAALETAYQMPDGAMSVGDASTDGDDILLSGVTFSVETEDGEVMAIPAGDMRFTAVSQTENGGYQIDRIDMDAFVVQQQAIQVNVGKVQMRDLHLPAEPHAENDLPFATYSALSTGPVSVLTDGKTLAEIASITATMDIDSLPIITGSSRMDGVNFALPDTMSPQAVEIVDALQLQTVNADMSVTFFWNTETGDARIEDYALDVQNVGRLSMDAAIGGYSLDLAQQISDMNKAPSPANQRDVQQIMTMMENLTLIDAAITFDDSGVTTRALDYAGKKQGADGAQMAAMLPMLAGMGLAGMNLPQDLLTQITGSLTTYLGNPQNLTIRATPSAPVPFKDIAAAGAIGPQAILGLINLSVTANQ